MRYELIFFAADMICNLNNGVGRKRSKFIQQILKLCEIVLMFATYILMTKGRVKKIKNDHECCN